MLLAGPVLAQSGLRLPAQGEPGLDPAFARGWLGPDYDRFGTALHNWREAVGFAPGQRMQWSYTLNDRSSLGMGMANSRELEDQRQLSALRALLAHAGLGAQRRDAVARSVGPVPPARLPHRRAAPLLSGPFFRRYTPARMRLALFDLDNTLLAGDSDYEWGQFLVDRGVLEREAYEAQNRAFYEQYKAGTLDIHEFLGFALRPLAEHAPEELDALARASSCASASRR